MKRKRALKADWRKIAHTLKRELDDALAHSKLNHALLTEAIDNLETWKRIWSTDSRHWYEQAKKQSEIITALVEGNRVLRTALDRYEAFHVRSKDLRA
jgi:hypothetical protein